MDDPNKTHSSSLPSAGAVPALRGLWDLIRTILIAGLLAVGVRTVLFEPFNIQDELDEKRRGLGVSDDVAALGVFSNQMLVTLGEKGVKSLDDLADLAGDELVEILGGEVIDEEAANEIIMAARAHWFEGEEAAGEAAREASGETAEGREASDV